MMENNQDDYDFIPTPQDDQERALYVGSLIDPILKEHGAIVAGIACYQKLQEAVTEVLYSGQYKDEQYGAYLTTLDKSLQDLCKDIRQDLKKRMINQMFTTTTSIEGSHLVMTFVRKPEQQPEPKKKKGWLDRVNDWAIRTIQKSQERRGVK